MKSIIFSIFMLSSCLVFAKGGGYGPSAEVQVLGGWNNEIQRSGSRSVKAMSANCSMTASQANGDLYSCEVNFRFQESQCFVAI